MQYLNSMKEKILKRRENWQQSHVILTKAAIKQIAKTEVSKYYT